MNIDLLKIRLTLTAADRAAEKLAQAIRDYDHETIARELSDLRGELAYLRQLTERKEESNVSVQDDPLYMAWWREHGDFTDPKDEYPAWKAARKA